MMTPASHRHFIFGHVGIQLSQAPISFDQKTNILTVPLYWIDRIPDLVRSLIA